MPDFKNKEHALCVFFCFCYTVIILPEEGGRKTLISKQHGVLFWRFEMSERIKGVSGDRERRFSLRLSRKEVAGFQKQIEKGITLISQVKYVTIKCKELRLITYEKFWGVFKIRKKAKRFYAGTDCGKAEYCYSGIK